MRFLCLFVAVAGLLVSGCGGGDRLAELEAEHRGASECLSWKDYVLIRYPEDESSGVRPGILMRLDGEDWVELGRSDRGFTSIHEVMTFVPEMDESGVEALGLH